MADSGQIDISEVFRRVQHEMLARLTTVRLFEHPTTNGTASELQWLDLLATYLPKRYRASPAFIINAQGQRSRQIDIAIYDQLNSPPIFPHAAGVHIPIECVYAVFEVKSNMNPKTLRDAGEKAGSVRALAGPRAGKILAGILSTRAHWGPERFRANLVRALALPNIQRLDMGCALEHMAFEIGEDLAVSEPGEALIFFVLRLIHRLNDLGPAPPVDTLAYLRRAS